MGSPGNDHALGLTLGTRQPHPQALWDGAALVAPDQASLLLERAVQKSSDSISLQSVGAG